jgi:antitoxin HicB
MHDTMLMTRLLVTRHFCYILTMACKNILLRYRHTFGENRDEALLRAVDAVETALMGYVEDRRDIPAADAGQRGNFITLPALTEAKLALYQAMRAARVGKAELGRRLSCHLPQVDRLLDLRHASRLDQLEAAFSALGKRLSVEIHEAA